MNHDPLLQGDNHPARGRARVPPPAPAPAPRSSWRRSMKWIYQGVLGAGAVAGAITAVVALLVPHNVEDAADFKSVTIIPDVPFNDYEQRLVAPHSRANGLGPIGAPVLMAYAGGDESPVPQPAVTPTPEGTEKPTTPDAGDSGVPGQSGDGTTRSSQNSTFNSVDPSASGAHGIVPPTMSGAATQGTEAAKQAKNVCKEQLSKKFCDSPISALLVLHSDG
jgi:hypothetical protein